MPDHVQQSGPNGNAHHGFRASDQDRLAVAEVLQDAVGRGLLTPTEGSERTAAAYAAVFRDDLTSLTIDLPPAAVTIREDQRRWSRAQAMVTRLWLAVWATVSGWSPQRRIGVAAVLAVLLLGAIGFGLLGVGEEHEGPGRDVLEGFRD